MSIRIWRSLADEKPKLRWAEVPPPTDSKTRQRTRALAREVAKGVIYRHKDGSRRYKPNAA